MDNRKIFLNSIKEMFVDDYKTIEDARCSVNELLEKYDIVGYEYNIFCSTLLNMLENIINNTSDEKLSSINIHSEVMNILNEMLINKIEDSNNEDSAKILEYLKQQRYE